MFNYAGLLAVALAGRHVAAVHLLRAAHAALLIAILMPLGYGAVVLAGPTRNGVPMRVNWPQAEIAERFISIWEKETGAPLRLVGGSTWVSGLVALDAPGAPGVLPRRIGPTELSAIERHGVLLVWDARKDHPLRIEDLIPGREIRREQFALRHGRNAEAIWINYAVVPPSASGSRF
jgi:hypothetical protein